MKIKCNWCGCAINKSPSKIKRHNFCSRGCLAKFSSRKSNPDGYADLKDYRNIRENMKRLNIALNPTRMNFATQLKIRAAHLGKGSGKSYPKILGRHAHRGVAEQKLGRPLHKGEVVHHIDGDKRNFSPDNLQIFSSQSEHVKQHHNRKVGDDK